MNVCAKLLEMLDSKCWTFLNTTIWPVWGYSLCSPWTAHENNNVNKARMMSEFIRSPVSRSDHSGQRGVSVPIGHIDRSRRPTELRDVEVTRDRSNDLSRWKRVATINSNSEIICSDLIWSEGNLRTEHGGPKIASTCSFWINSIDLPAASASSHWENRQTTLTIEQNGQQKR